MGYIRHHAIAVTSYSEEKMQKAREKAIEIFETGVTPLIESRINEYISFFIAPDGSKEGWEDSDTGDEQRAIFVKWINEQAYEDGSNGLNFCEFFYGDDNGDSMIVSHN